MKRRQFIKSSSLAGLLTTIPFYNSFANNQLRDMKTHHFNLNYAPHIGMFKEHSGEDVIDQLNFMADQGFTAFEDNEMKMKNRPVSVQKAMAKTMKKRNLEMGVFVAHKIYWKEPNLASGKDEWRNEFLNDIKSSVEVAKRVNAKWMTVVPGHVDLQQNMAYQTAHVVETLKQACTILEPHGLVMVLEPLNFRNHPGLFLSESTI